MSVYSYKTLFHVSYTEEIVKSEGAMLSHAIASSYLEHCIHNHILKDSTYESIIIKRATCPRLIYVITDSDKSLWNKSFPYVYIILSEIPETREARNRYYTYGERFPAAELQALSPNIAL